MCAQVGDVVRGTVRDVQRHGVLINLDTAMNATMPAFLHIKNVSHDLTKYGELSKLFRKGQTIKVREAWSDPQGDRECTSRHSHTQRDIRQSLHAPHCQKAPATQHPCTRVVVTLGHHLTPCLARTSYVLLWPRSHCESQ